MPGWSSSTRRHARDCPLMIRHVLGVNRAELLEHGEARGVVPERVHAALEHFGEGGPVLGALGVALQRVEDLHAPRIDRRESRCRARPLRRRGSSRSAASCAISVMQRELRGALERAQLSLDRARTAAAKPGASCRAPKIARTPRRPPGRPRAAPRTPDVAFCTFENCSSQRRAIEAEELRLLAWVGDRSPPASAGSTRRSRAASELLVEPDDFAHGVHVVFVDLERSDSAPRPAPCRS